MRTHDLLLAVACCAVVTVLAGCSDSTAGQAQPTGTTATGGTSEQTPTTSATRSSGSPTKTSPLDGVNPCELLSDSDRQQLGLAEGEPSNLGRSRGCDWQQSGVWGVAIGLQPDLAFKDANFRGATPQRVDIGRHEAYRVENAGNGKACEIFVVTSESSFVQITVTFGTDVAKACGKALPVAKIVDPKLP